MTTALPAVSVGQELSPLRVAPISRSTLALFAGASGDVNPIHIDLDIARSAGLDDVFAHGMLSMAYLGRFLTDWMPQARLRRWRVRFSAITPVHAEPVCTGVVAAIDNGIATLDIAVRLADGTVTLSGTADVDVTSPLSGRPS